MNKNERLFDILGEVSPVYVAEATEMKQKTRGGVSLSRKKMFALLAAVLALTILSGALLLPGSAVVPEEGDVVYYEFGTVLTEIPRVMAAEDYRAMVAMMEEKVAQQPEMLRTFDRFLAFYTRQSLEEQKAQVAREGLLRAYPIVALTDIYTLDSQTSMVEDEFLLYLLMYYAEMSQEKLIQIYTNMYDIVDASTLSEEEKEDIRATLPEIPVITQDAPVTFWVSGEKIEGSELQFSSAFLPAFLTQENYDQLCAMVNADKATTSRDEPQYLFMLEDMYKKLPVSEYSSLGVPYEEQSAAINAHLQVLIDAIAENGQVVYVLDPYATLHQRTMLCYYISQKTEITEEQLGKFNKDFNAMLDSLPLSEKQIDNLKEKCHSLQGTLNP